MTTAHILILVYAGLYTLGAAVGYRGLYNDAKNHGVSLKRSTRVLYIVVNTLICIATSMLFFVAHYMLTMTDSPNPVMAKAGGMWILGATLGFFVQQHRRAMIVMEEIHDDLAEAEAKVRTRKVDGAYLFYCIVFLPLVIAATLLL